MPFDGLSEYVQSWTGKAIIHACRAVPRLWLPFNRCLRNTHNNNECPSRQFRWRSYPRLPNSATIVACHDVDTAQISDKLASALMNTLPKAPTFCLLNADDDVYEGRNWFLETQFSRRVFRQKLWSLCSDEHTAMIKSRLFQSVSVVWHGSDGFACHPKECRSRPSTPETTWLPALILACLMTLM